MSSWTFDADASAYKGPPSAARFLLIVLVLLILSACSSRQVQDSLTGSTAQRLVAHSIDQLMEQLPPSDFESLRGQLIGLETHFPGDSELKDYADARLSIALADRFGIRISNNPFAASVLLKVFYTSLGTDQELSGFYLPVGVVPGVSNEARVNLISLEKFHGVAGLYYFLIADDDIVRGPTLISRVRSDALGLPIITIPLSGLPEAER